MALNLANALPPSGHTSTTDNGDGDVITLPVTGLVGEVHVYLDDTVDGTYELEDSAELPLGFGAWVRVWELPVGVPADLRPDTVTIRSGSATAGYSVRTVPAGRS
jgi:hypothetical protein